MAEHYFSLEIITPIAQAFAGEVSLVELPGVEGQMGILAGHEPLLALLVPGVVHVRDRRHDLYFAMGSGFVQVVENRATVLSMFAQRPEEIDRDRAQKEKAEQEQKLAQGLSEEPAREARLKILAAQARLKVAGLGEGK